MGKGAGFLASFLVFVGAASLLVMVGLFAYSQFVLEKPDSASGTKFILQTEAAELKVENQRLETELSKSHSRLTELKSLNVRLQGASNQFNSEKEVILAQVKDSVRGFLEYKEETIEEIDKLKSSLEVLEVEKAGLSGKFDTLSQESEATNTILTSQIHELNQIIDRHKRKIIYYKDLTARRDNKEVVVEVAKLHYNLGNFYFKNAEYTNAVDEYKKSLLYRPDDPDTHFNLAVVYDERLGHRERAVKHYKTYLALNPEDSNILDIENRILDLELQLEVVASNTLANPSS